jgi:hypothetical protein
MSRWPARRTEVLPGGHSLGGSGVALHTMARPDEARFVGRMLQNAAGAIRARRGRCVMHHENPLDHAIHRFQHRWETDRQFRAAMSGVLGLLLVVALCGGVSVLDLAATRALAAVGISVSGSGGPGQYNTDTGVQDNGNGPIYTPTVPTWGPQGIPQASPNPTSPSNVPTATPSPTPTDAATKTPCTSNCGGGGSVAGNITAVPSPSNWVSGQPGAAFTVYATDGNNQPEAGVRISIIFVWSNGQWLDQSNSPTLSPDGHYTSYPQVGGCPSSHVMTAKVYALFPGGRKDFNFSIPCH